MFALLLNDMRQPNCENIQVVRTAATAEELISWYTPQIADEPWSDGKWGKTFKRGSDLEWFNPPVMGNAADLSGRNDYWGGIWEVPDGTPGFSLVKAHSRAGF